MSSSNKFAIIAALTLMPLLITHGPGQLPQRLHTILVDMSSQPLPTKQAAVPERYVIYSAALNYLYENVYKKSGVKLIVISDETEDQQKLKRQLNLRTNYVLVTKSSLDALLLNQNKNAFSNQYKTAPGYMLLSAISFQGETQAKLNIELACGFLCGIGWYFKLSKKDGTWTVDEQKLSWQK